MSFEPLKARRGPKLDTRISGLDAGQAHTDGWGRGVTVRPLREKVRGRVGKKRGKLTLARFTGLSGRGLRIQQGLSNASNVIALLALGFR